MVNCHRDYVALQPRLDAFQAPVLIGFEAPGTDHRPLAYFLHQCGFALRRISSVAVARTREALYNSWDKNDPQDTPVLLHVLKTGVCQRYHDPLVHAVNAVQELAQTHDLLRYFPDIARYSTHSRAQWFTRLLHRFPCPTASTRYSCEAFEREAWTIVGRKVHTRGLL